MINNPLLTLNSINENGKTLKRNIFNELENSFRETGIRVTPEAKKELEEKISLFVHINSAFISTPKSKFIPLTISFKITLYLFL